MMGLTSLALAIMTGAPAWAHEPNASHWPTVGELREEHSPEREAEMRKLVWMTPLGLLVRDYLLIENNPRHVNRLANRITYRMFSSGPLAIGRQTALVLMKRDLYETGRVDQRVQLRWSQLESDILLRKASIEERSTDALAYKLVMPVLLGALWGVPQLREGSKGIAVRVINKIKSWHSDEGATAMMTYATYAFEGSTVALTAYLYYHNFIATGNSHDDGLIRRYFNKWLQSHTSIEYL